MDSQRWLILFVLIVTVWGLTDVRSRGRINPQHPTQRNGHMTDVTVYTEAGAAIFDGRDPYLVTSPRGWHYLYPPIFAITMAPLARLNSQWQVVVWFAVSVLAGWGCWQELRRLSAWPHDNDVDEVALAALPACSSETTTLPRWLCWTTAAAVLLPALNCLQRGQLGIALTYLLLFGMRLSMAQNWRTSIAGGVVLALPVAIKLTPALPVAFACWLLLTNSWVGALGRISWKCAWGATAGVVIGLVIFLLALPIAVVGPAKNAQFLSSWFHRVAANRDVGTLNDFNVHSCRNQSLANSVYLFSDFVASFVGGSAAQRLNDDENWKDVSPTSFATDQAAAHLCLLVLQLLLLGLLLAAGGTAARHGERLQLAAVTALACMLTLIISPLSWVHHYVLWLPAMWLLPLLFWRQNRKALAFRLSLAGCILVWMHYLFLPIAGRVGLLGLGTAVWFVIAAASLLRDRKSVPQMTTREPVVASCTFGAEG